MDDGYQILRNLSDNEEIAKKLFEIEVSILSIGSFKTLFERLLLLIEEKFGFPHLWISLIAESELSHLIEALESSELLKNRLSFVQKGLLLDLLEHKSTPILINENLQPFYRLFPENHTFFVKSLAIAPLVLDGEIIGTLNLGDFSELRFQPTMDTFFLSQLAVKISICLSNVSAHEKLKFVATRDSVTSLFNRRELEKMLEREFSRTKRYGTPLAVLFIDCNDFEMVNHAYGHTCGDALLKYIADHVTRMIRRDDLAFRFAGDEFVVLLPNQTTKEASTVSERLSGFFRENPLKFGDAPIPVSATCGFASTEDPGANSPGALLKKAEERLCQAKSRKDVRR